MLRISLGMLLIASALQDQFQSLFHPAGHGVMSDRIAALVWKGMRRFARGKPGPLSLAGPFAMVVIIATWIMLLIIGFALVYRSAIHGFVATPGLEYLYHRSWWDAVNVSSSSMITVAVDLHAGFGWIRFLMTLESFFGLALLTASVSWILSIYPTLETRSSVAQEAQSIYEAQEKTGIDLLSLEDDHVRDVLLSLAEQITSVRNETVQFPITYYFGVRNERGSLARILPFIRDLADRACMERRPASVIFAGSILNSAVESYVELLASRYFHVSADDEMHVLHLYARDNNRKILALQERDNLA